MLKVRPKILVMVNIFLLLRILSAGGPAFYELALLDFDHRVTENL